MGNINYKLKQYKNKNSEYNDFYYPRAVITGESDLNDIAEKIQANSSLKKGDVLACLTELVEYIREGLLDSKRVRINGLGIFRIGIDTKQMVEKIEDFSVRECVAGYHVNFLPEYTIEPNGRRSTRLLAGATLSEYQEYAEGVNNTKKGKKINIGEVQ